MFQKFKNQINELEKKVEEILHLQKNINRIYEKRGSEEFMQSIRHRLGSIDLMEDKEREMTSTQRKVYLQRIATFFPKGIEKDIKSMIAEQLKFMGQQSQNIEQFWFARGTVNGLFLLLEKYERLYEEYIESHKPKEKIDKTNLFPEV